MLSLQTFLEWWIIWAIFLTWEWSVTDHQELDKRMCERYAVLKICGHVPRSVKYGGFVILILAAFALGPLFMWRNFYGRSD